MQRRGLIASILTGLVLLLASCANGGADDAYTSSASVEDEGGASGDGAPASETGPNQAGRDSGIVAHFDAAGDGSAPSADDSGSPDDAPSGEDSSVPVDSGGAQDTGSMQDVFVVVDSSAPPDSGTSTAICPNTAKYALEAAASVAGGHPTLCLLGSPCAAGQCCYEELNPGNICVAQ
jgi:hypothetical protein